MSNIGNGLFECLNNSGALFVESYTFDFTENILNFTKEQIVKLVLTFSISFLLHKVG